MRCRDAVSSHRYARTIIGHYRAHDRASAQHKRPLPSQRRHAICARAHASSGERRLVVRNRCRATVQTRGAPLMTVGTIAVDDEDYRTQNYLLRRLVEEINRVTTEFNSITNYGASTSATGAANAAAIQRAIDATPDGGTLWIPSGTYAVTASCTITRSIIIRGFGFGSILNVNGMSGSVSLFVINTSSFTPGFTFRDFFVSSSGDGKYAIDFAGSGGVYEVL